MYKHFSKKQSTDEILLIKNHTYSADVLGLIEDKTRSGFICPFCGAGQGKNGTGLVYIPQGRPLRGGGRASYNTYYCFSCEGVRTGEVGRGYSAIDLYMQRHGYSQSEFHKAIQELKVLAGVEVASVSSARPFKVRTDEVLNAPRADEDIKKARQYIADSYPLDCLAEKYRRGIPNDIAMRFNIKFHDRQADEYHKGFFLDDARIVVPYTDSTFTARRVEWQDEDAHMKVVRFEGRKPSKYRRNKGEFHFFNESTIINGGAKFVLVTEGTFDAISGYCARVEDADFISLEGANEVDRFVKFLKKHNFHKSGRILIYFADNDKQGNFAKVAMKKLCPSEGIDVLFADIPKIVNGEECKDFGDFYRIDADAFRSYLHKTIEAVIDVRSSLPREDGTDALFDADLYKAEAKHICSHYEETFATEARACPF